VLVEGNYVSLPMEPWCHLKDLFDERWFITCDPAIARARVIARHIGTGNSVEQATTRADGNDVPNGALVEAKTRATGWATRVIESR
jgi:pantothenate kinase